MRAPILRRKRPDPGKRAKTIAGPLQRTPRERTPFQAWRSAWCEYGPPKVPTDPQQHFPEWAQLLAIHSVPSGKTAIITKIEVAPTLYFPDDGYRFPEIPGQEQELQPPGSELPRAWRFRWLLAEALWSPLADAFLGLVLPSEGPGEPILRRLAAILNTLHGYHGEPQRLFGAYTAMAQHRGRPSYVVHGPAFVGLLALVIGGQVAGGDQIVPPFGNSYGCLEGIDLATDLFLESPARWIAP